MLRTLLMSLVTLMLALPAFAAGPSEIAWEKPVAERSLEGGGFRHAASDPTGPYLIDTLTMARGMLALYELSANAPSSLSLITAPKTPNAVDATPTDIDVIPQPVVAWPVP
ncbi:MAG: hypothetical protein ACI9OJ_005829, partial [Myxococcota bacterium]